MGIKILTTVPIQHQEVQYHTWLIFLLDPSVQEKMKQLFWTCHKQSNQAWFAPVHESVVAPGKMYFSSTVFTIGKMTATRDNLNASVLYV